MSDRGGLPDPGRAGSLDELAVQLRALKVWAGDPSYETITGRINAAWQAAGRPAVELARKSTVADCFRTGRRRLNAELALAIAASLHADTGYLARWRQAFRVVAGEIQAAAQVRVQDLLPADLAEFSGRRVEVEQLQALLLTAQLDGQAVLCSGMAGAGKTQLAVRAGHLLAAEHAFDRVLFVNLRGFHRDPDRPPADPAAVLDGFLRLLGVPGQAIPHCLEARAAAYRERLAGQRVLVVLDDAATAEQLEPLLPRTPGCLTLVTSRRCLDGVEGLDSRLPLDVFTAEEARTYLADAAPEARTGPDPRAAARIAERCGKLPLALGLVAGHIRATPDWTLTDHADRLDERRTSHRLDTEVELALDLSYRHLPAEQRRLLRLAAEHPGQDFDMYAVAALTNTDLGTAGHQLEQLRRDHLLEQRSPGRYTFHDLVRAHAAVRAGDEERPADRRAALTRLFDYYLSTAIAAADIVVPGEVVRAVTPPPISTPAPSFDGAGAGRAWLEEHHPTLAALLGYCATSGWASHTTRLATALAQHIGGAHPTEAVNLHQYALQAAKAADDQGAEAAALVRIGFSHMFLGQHELAQDFLQQGLTLAREVDEPEWEIRALNCLGIVARRVSDFEKASQHLELALARSRETGHTRGEANALNYLGELADRLGRHDQAVDYLERALTQYGIAGNRFGEANALRDLGNAERKRGRHEAAARYLTQARAVFRESAHLAGEGSSLDDLGNLYRQMGRPADARDHFVRGLAILSEVGETLGTVCTRNGLGESLEDLGDHAAATDHYQIAHETAVRISAWDEVARALTGLGRCAWASEDRVRGCAYLERAISLYRELGMTEADEVRLWQSTNSE